MIGTTSHLLRRAVPALAAAALLAACADHTPVEPDSRSAGSTSYALSPAEQAAASDGRLPDLGTCIDHLQVPEGSKISFHVYATGVQIYRWDGASWIFVSPMADLFADAGRNGLVGTHFGGPTWQTVSGSRVVGTVVDHCNPDASAIAWLKLTALPSGSGVFEHTSFIQRLFTVGGNAPTTPGSIVGEEIKVPYTSEYYFYQAP